MGLSFNTLVNAALLGVPAYQTGKRKGEADIRAETRQKALDDRQATLDQSTLEDHSASSKEALSLAALHQDQMENPGKYRTTPAKSASAEKTEYFDAQVATGKTPAQANEAVRLRFGDAPVKETGPVPGSAEWVRMETTRADINGRAQEKYRRDPVGSDPTKEAAKDKREFMENRITYHLDHDGMSGSQAQSAAEREYNGAQYSAGHSGTAAALSRSIPTASASAGRSGPRSAATSSTPAQDPSSSTSPPAGARPVKVLPPGVDKEMYRKDPEYRAYVDSNLR